jgi:curved DNA-binding protein CbpA
MPTDQFALLEKPRRPWLDPGELKETFHRRSAEAHPDRAGSDEEFAALNTAYSILRDPSQRLRHLLELEHPEALTSEFTVPPLLAEIFIRLATFRRALDAFIQQQSCASTPLGQALLASERFALQRDAERELAATEGAQQKLLQQLEELDARWEARRPETIRELAAIQQELMYFGKWNWQLREALFRMDGGTPVPS